MFKSLGFLLGIVIATVLLLSLLNFGRHPDEGIPIPESELVVHEPVSETALETMNPIALAQNEPDTIRLTAASPDTAAELPMEKVSMSLGEPIVIDTEDAIPPDSEESTRVEATNTDVAPGDEVVISQELQWHAFWKPFHSELSAKGFTQRLERITGLDYRIVKVAAGEYQVAFAYFNEQEKRSSLDRIEAATGLRLQGTRL